MTTLWSIPIEARRAMSDGKHVRLKSLSTDDDVVLALEEEVDELFTACDWEIEDKWQK